MFARVFALLPLALLASASHLVARDTNNCNTGDNYCCNSASAIGSHQVAAGSIGSLVSVAAPILTAVGLTCTVGIENCSQQPVCCDNVNDYGSLISVKCNSISA